MRRTYLVALCVLQVMLAWQLVPIVALVLIRHVPLGHAADGWPAVAEVASAALCVVGSGLTLSYPSFIRNRQHWAAGFPFGALRITAADFARIAAPMGQASRTEEHIRAA